MRIRGALTTLLLVSLLLIAGCRQDATEADQGATARGEPGSWPVARAVGGAGIRTSFYPAEDADWQSLVDMSVFRGFRAGMTGEDATRTVGAPDRYHEEQGELYWVYERPGAEVVVARKRKASLFGGWWWRLEAVYDPPVPPAGLLHPSVVAELPEDLERHTVIIMNKNAEGRIPAVWIYIEDGKVVRIDVSPSGARGPDPG